MIGFREHCEIVEIVVAEMRMSGWRMSALSAEDMVIEEVTAEVEVDSTVKVPMTLTVSPL